MTSLLAPYTGHPLSGPKCWEMSPRHPHEMGQHAVLPEAAIFVGRHLVLADSIEACRDLGHKTGNDHRIGVGVRDNEAVRDIWARQAEPHQRPDRHRDALWCKRVLVRDHPHRHHAVRLDSRAEVALYELATE